MGARKLFEHGLYAEAVGKLLEALDGDQIEDGDSATLLSLLTRSYANLGQLDEAVEWSEKAIAADTVNPDHYYLHATILQEQGKDDEAWFALRRAVFLDPNYVVAHFALGNLERSRGRLTDSERHYKIALSILGDYGEREAVPASDGMTAAELIDMISAMTRKEIPNEWS